MENGRKPQGQLVITFMGDEAGTIHVGCNGPFCVPEHKDEMIRACAEAIRHLSALDPKAVQPAIWTPGMRG
jgi:hypothetical protein